MSEQAILEGGAPVEPVVEPVVEPAGNLLENQPAPDTFEFPEAFRVMNGDQIDATASAKALAEAYAARAAFGEIPANDAEYAAPEGFEGWEEIKQMDAVKQFSDEARKLGFTNEQYAFALKNISAAELDGRQYQVEANRQASENALRDAWPEPVEYDLNLKQANNAVLALIPEDERKEFLGRYGNDATVIKMLARIGGELSEDVALGILQPVPSGEDVKSLMQSEAYMNSKHPQHSETMRKVQMFYAKHYGTQAAL